MSLCVLLPYPSGCAAPLKTGALLFSCISRKEQGSRVKGTERGLAGQAKESIEGKVALSTPVM